MQNVLKVLLILFFGSAEWLFIVTEALFITGLYPLLKKSGIKPWWAFVPVMRRYMLCRCAGCEKEGRVLLVLEVASLAVTLSGSTIDILSFSVSATAVTLALLVVTLIYDIRVARGLTNTYGKSRWWIPLWIFLRFIPALIWGFSDRYTPGESAKELEVDDRLEEERIHGKHTWLGDFSGNSRRLLKFFAFRYDWVNLPIAVVLTTIVASIAKADFFTSMDGTVKGSLALTCTAIWNGCFNSIKTICRERGNVRRMKEKGMYISSYIVAVIIYQALLCLTQTVLAMYTCTLIGIRFPYDGVIVNSLVFEIGITMFLISFAADMLCLCISATVKEVATAMTVMPFILVLQLVFSGSVINISAWSNSISRLTISSYGVKCIAAQAGYNDKPMMLGWNLLESIRDNEVGTEFTVGQLMDTLSDAQSNPSVERLRNIKVGRVFTVGEIRDLILGSELVGTLLDMDLRLDMSIGEVLRSLQNADLIPTNDELKEQTFGKVFTVGEIYDIISKVDAFKTVKDKKILFNVVSVGDALDLIMSFVGDLEVNTQFQLGQLVDTVMDSAVVRELLDKRPLQGMTIRAILEKVRAFETLDAYADTEIDATFTIGEVLDWILSHDFLQEYRDKDIVLKTTIGKLIDTVGEDTVRSFVLEKTSEAAMVPAYAHTRENILDYWGDLGLFILVFTAAFVLIMLFSTGVLAIGKKKVLHGKFGDERMN